MTKETKIMYFKATILDIFGMMNWKNTFFQ